MKIKEPNGRCCLYRHFSKDGKLLYVGISNLESRRRGQHKSQAKWFADICNVEIVEFETREQAVEAEKIAIAAESPLFNIESRRTLSTKAAAGRKRLERERTRERGFVLRQFWVHPKDWPRVQKYLARIFKERK